MIRTIPRAVSLETIKMIPYEGRARRSEAETTFIRGISAVSNAIQTIDNEANHLIIYCLNCIRHGRNATYEPGLSDRVGKLVRHQ